MKTAVRALVAWGLVLSHPAFAQVRPNPGNGDPRLQTILYDPEQIVQLSVAIGYQLMVGFAPGERIETIAVGDSNAWQVTATKRGEYLFVKHVQNGDASNLTVVTSARVYIFELVGSFGGSSDAYVVRFIYPEFPKPSVEEQAAPAATRYRLSGARSIRPSLIGRDGNKVFLEWPVNAALPATFRRDEDGEETLVNGEMQGQQFVIGGQPDQLIFRLGRLTATAVRVRPRGSRK